MRPNRLLRAFDVLELLSRNPKGMRLSQIGEELDLPLSSTHGLLKTMTEVELLTASGDKMYRVGPRALRLALRLGEGIAFRQLGASRFRALATEIGYDVYVATRVGDEVVYVDRFEGVHPVAIDIPMGRRLYLHATAVGKLYAAFHSDLRDRALTGPMPRVTRNTITDARSLETNLVEIRSSGYAVSNGEGVEGIKGLAVPICDDAGALVGAIHVSVIRAAGADEKRLLAAATETARAVERDMGVVSEELG